MFSFVRVRWNKIHARCWRWKSGSQGGLFLFSNNKNISYLQTYFLTQGKGLALHGYFLWNKTRLGFTILWWLSYQWRFRCYCSALLYGHGLNLLTNYLQRKHSWFEHSYYIRYEDPYSKKVYNFKKYSVAFGVFESSDFPGESRKVKRVVCHPEFRATYKSELYNKGLFIGLLNRILCFKYSFDKCLLIWYNFWKLLLANSTWYLFDRIIGQNTIRCNNSTSLHRYPSAHGRRILQGIFHFSYMLKVHAS